MTKLTYTSNFMILIRIIPILILGMALEQIFFFPNFGTDCCDLKEWTNPPQVCSEMHQNLKDFEILQCQKLETKMKTCEIQTAQLLMPWLCCLMLYWLSIQALQKRIQRSLSAGNHRIIKAQVIGKSLDFWSFFYPWPRVSLQLPPSKDSKTQQPTEIKAYFASASSPLNAGTWIVFSVPLLGIGSKKTFAIPYTPHIAILKMGS